MWVITITTEKMETLTILVAKDAFKDVQPSMGEEERVTILQNFAARVLMQYSKSTALPKFPIYLEKIEFTEADAKATLYLQKDANTVITQTAKFQHLRSQRQSLIGEAGILKYTCKEHADDDKAFADSRLAFTCAQPLPPVSRIDAVSKEMPLHGNEYTIAYHGALVEALTKNSLNPEDISAAHKMAAVISTFKQSTLEAIRDEWLGDISEIDDIRNKYSGNQEERAAEFAQGIIGRNETRDKVRSLNDKHIKSEFGHIDHDKAAIDTHISQYLTADYEYRAMIEKITNAIYNAAKDYFFEKWAENQSDISKLKEFRSNFNDFFLGLVVVNDDFTLSPSQETYRLLLEKNLDAEALEKMLSTLLNASYKNGLFNHLAKRLNALNGYFEDIAEQKLWNHKLAFADPLKSIFAERTKSYNDLISIPIRHITGLYDSIETSKKAVATEAEAIRKELRPNQAKTQRRRGSFWERNKATISSFIGGIIIGAAAASAIALAHLAFPPLIVATIAVVSAVAIIGLSFLVGKIIDRCCRAKPKKTTLTTSDTGESERLLSNFEHAVGISPTPVTSQTTNTSAPPAFMYSSNKPDQEERKIDLHVENSIKLT